jgi:hypothetical protein
MHRQAPFAGRTLHFIHGGCMRTEPVAPVRQRDAGSATEQLVGPIERGVAAADDEDPLASKDFWIGDDVEDAPAVSGMGDRLRQPARREGADARRDHD